MKTTVSSKGQIVLPAEIREQDQIEPGQEFEVERIDRGEYRLKRRSPPPNKDSLIAATALVHEPTVVMRNRAAFDKAGVQVVDPRAARAPQSKGRQDTITTQIR